LTFIKKISIYSNKNTFVLRYCAAADILIQKLLINTTSYIRIVCLCFMLIFLV